MVAAISGQVSLVAVVANLVVAVVVGPATVLGLLGGVLVLLVQPAGLACGWLAGLCASWIITVATHLARLPTAALDWAPGVTPVLVLGVLCVGVGLGAGAVLRRPRWSVALSLVLVVVMLRPLPSPGWPPAGWVLVACDVGQGDGLVLKAGGGAAVAALAVLCVLLALAMPRVLNRRRWSFGAAMVMVLTVVRPLPSPGWPPSGWVLVACDVGQGDGLVLNAGGGTAVVVDTGPDPPAMSACLDRLGVERLAVVVLTHFHADHVDGLAAVLDGRRVGEVDVTATEDPAYGAVEVRRRAAAARVPVRVPGYGEVRRLGQLTWQVVGPVSAASGGEHGEEGSAANNASLVLLVDVRGVRILMSGDMEPEAQQRLDASLPGLRVDVLKVPHHGSRYQDPDLLGSLGARLAVVSVGRDNEYGHPATATLALLRRAGLRVERTDEDGDVAVTVRDGRLGVTARGSRRR